MDQTNVRLISCPHCGAQMPEAAGFCPSCGRPMLNETPSASGARGKVGVLPETIAGGLAYFTFVPAILFLVTDPYNKNEFVRFHSVQCLLFWLVAVIIAFALRLAGLVLFMIPVLGPLLVFVISVVIALAALFIWLVLVVKALQGQTFQLPVLGSFAERYATPL